jgi:ferrous iron transport protein A
MMPLILSKAGEESVILRAGGSPEVRQHLNDLGFVAGTGVTVLNVIGGNLIVKVKESRVAISREMAQKIMVQ